MITNNKKQTNRNNKHLRYIIYQCTKNVNAQPIFSSKNITSFFQDSTRQVKIKLHTTIGGRMCVYIICVYTCMC